MTSSIFNTMIFSEADLKVLVFLSDEKGHGNNELTRLIYGDDRNKGNITHVLSKLMGPDGSIEKFGSKTNYQDYNLHIKKKLDIFKIILDELNMYMWSYERELFRLEEKWKISLNLGEFNDEDKMKFVRNSEDMQRKKESFSEDFFGFIYSQYTGEMIKKYSLEEIIKSIPKMGEKSFIEFIDWTYEKGFVDSHQYAVFIFSLREFMVTQFEQRSKFFKDIKPNYKGLYFGTPDEGFYSQNNDQTE